MLDAGALDFLKALVAEYDAMVAREYRINGREAGDLMRDRGISADDVRDRLPSARRLPKYLVAQGMVVTSARVSFEPIIRQHRPFKPATRGTRPSTDVFIKPTAKGRKHVVSLSESRRSLDVLLTVPHGAPGNDLNAPPVARALAEALRSKGAQVELLISECCRYTTADMNRAEGRGSDFRNAIAEVVTDLNPQLVIDVHSYPGDIARFAGQDIVLLHTEGLQDREWLCEYARELAKTEGLNVCVQPSEYPSDLCEQVRELGVAPNRIMLAEHNNDGDPGLYAEAHARVIERMLLDRMLSEGLDMSQAGDLVAVQDGTGFSARQVLYLKNAAGRWFEVNAWETRGQWYGDVIRLRAAASPPDGQLVARTIDNRRRLISHPLGILALTDGMGAEDAERGDVYVKDGDRLRNKAEWGLALEPRHFDGVIKRGKLRILWSA